MLSERRDPRGGSGVLFGSGSPKKWQKPIEVDGEGVAAALPTLRPSAPLAVVDDTNRRQTFDGGYFSLSLSVLGVASR